MCGSETRPFVTRTPASLAPSRAGLPEESTKSPEHNEPGAQKSLEHKEPSPFPGHSLGAVRASSMMRSALLHALAQPSRGPARLFAFVELALPCSPRENTPCEIAISLHRQPLKSTHTKQRMEGAEWGPHRKIQKALNSAKVESGGRWTFSRSAKYFEVNSSSDIQPSLSSFTGVS